MQIYVNTEPLDFELKQNLALSAILHHIEEWAVKQDGYITNYTVMPVAGAMSSTLHADDIDRLDVEIGTRDDLIRVNLQEMQNYLDKLGSFLAARIGSTESLTTEESFLVQEGVDYVLEASTMLENFLGENASLQDARRTLTEETDPAQRLQALAFIRNYSSAWLQTIEIKSIPPEVALARVSEFFSRLPDLEAELESIAGALTLGQDATALNGLEAIASVLSDGIALMHATGRLDEEHRVITRDTVNLLSDLTASLSMADRVAAADIVDYDLRDAIARLAALESVFQDSH